MAFSTLNGTKFREYQTVEGDRFDIISFKAYGDATKFDRIIQANPGLPITGKLPGGKVIRIPIVQAVEETNQDLLPPWKRTQSPSTSAAIAAGQNFQNPPSSLGGSFDESFD